MTKSIYVFNDVQFEIELTVKEAFRLKTEQGINLLKLFEGNNLDEFSMMLSFDDEKVIDLWWDVICSKFSDREACVDKLTRDDLTKFKEAYWAAVVNFSDPAAKPILLEVKKRLPGLLKQQACQRMNDLEKIPQNENSSNT